MKYFSSDVINILNFTSGHPNLEHINTEQECIPVGCVLLAQVAIPSGMHAPPTTHVPLCHAHPSVTHIPATHAPLPHMPPYHAHPPCHMCTPWHACCLAMHTPLPCMPLPRMPPPPPGRQTLVKILLCPILRMRVVKMWDLNSTLDTCTSVLLIRQEEEEYSSITQFRSNLAVVDPVFSRGGANS